MITVFTSLRTSLFKSNIYIYKQHSYTNGNKETDIILDGHDLSRFNYITSCILFVNLNVFFTIKDVLLNEIKSPKLFFVKALSKMLLVNGKSTFFYGIH